MLNKFRNIVHIFYNLCNLNQNLNIKAQDAYLRIAIHNLGLFEHLASEKLLSGGEINEYHLEFNEIELEQN